MKKITRVSLGLSAAPFTIALAALAVPAQAQTVGTTPQDAAAAANNTTIPNSGDNSAAAANADTIVVTGSLIRNPNLTSSSPVLVTNREEINLRQSNNAEGLLRDIPGIVPAQGSAVNNGTGGFTTVNLRGLGDNRNVVLLDGSRIVPATLTGVVDLDDIPLALIERVDVLTGGATTTYGADAVAGVVNFVTRRNFSGVEVNASEQITQEGDAGVHRVDLTAGTNFGDGRGNLVVSLGYQKRLAVTDGDRDFSRDNIAAEDGSVGGSSVTPQTTFLNGAGKYRGLDPATGLLNVVAAPYNFNPYNLLQTPLERYNALAEGHYEVTDSIEVYARGLYSRNTVDTIVAPSGVFTQPLTISLNNPYLSATEAASLCALQPAQCAATGAITTNVKRRSSELGNRVSSFRTQVYDFNGGIRGNITDAIKFDVYGAYGESHNRQTLSGYADVTNIQQGLLLNADGTCTNASNGCVPINIFGPEGSLTGSQLAFIAGTSETEVRTSLAQAHGTISGDLGFSSPVANNPISFAVGGEYRRYTASQSADALAQNPGELGGSGSAVIPFSAAYHVEEGFGELNVPLVQERPLFHDLTLDAGIRYSRYKIEGTDNSFGTTTYKAGGVWEPIEGLKFRADYAHAVRAPNINELFSPVAVGLTNLAVDPCSGVAPTTNANLAAICRAQGAPAGSIGNITNPNAGQANILNSGNINLKPEKANTYTIGAVVSPRRIVPGLTASVDYYHIRITNAISTPAPDDSIGACFNNVTATSATSAACQLIHRDPADGTLSGDQAGTGTGLPGQYSNSGTLLTRGLDFNVSYARPIGQFHLGLAFNGNYTFTSKFRSQPGGLFRECIGYYSGNCSNGGGESIGSIQPKFQFSQRTTLGYGKAQLSLLWRHISPETYEPAAYIEQVAGAVGNGCADPAGADPDACVFDSKFRRIKSYNYFDLTAQFVATDHFTLTLLVQNLANRKPPIVGSDIGSTLYNSGNTYPSTYDALGRRFVVNARFGF